MKKDVVIKVEGLSKQYSIGKRDSWLTLRDKLMELPNKLFKKEKKPTFWALKEVSFEVKRGEVLGVIGRNGAGKSTLLKILARTTEPTDGKITMRGRVASILEVGTGFNAELTGRENIYLNGSILGMSRSEIQSKFTEITDFAGIGKFLDTPVKHYSSGMYVRLAFAVAAHLDSDILLVDEVLAVGDAEFQKKCLGKMSDMSRTGKTVILVSHNMHAVKKLCNIGISLDKGQIVSMGGVDKLISEYMRFSDIRKTFQPIKITELGVTLKKIRLNTSTKGKIYPDKPLKIDIELEAKRKVSGIGIQLMISNEDTNGRVFSTNTKVTDGLDVILNKGTNKLSLEINRFALSSGKYWLGFGLDIPFVRFYYQETELISFDVLETTLTNSQVPTLPAYGHVYMDHAWNIEK